MRRLGRHPHPSPPPQAGEGGHRSPGCIVASQTTRNALLTITGARLELSRFKGWAPVRVARAFRLSILAAASALALGGCMQTVGPVAVAQPRSDLDYMAYGEPAAPQPVAVVDNSGGGAISALRNSFAAAPAPAPVGYAAPIPAPMPVRYDASYHLDAGDKLRVV